MALKVWSRVETPDPKVQLWTITGMTENDTCEVLKIPGHADKTVRVNGTFGSATITCKGTLLPTDTSNEYLTHRDPGGSNVTFTSAGWAVLAENSYGVVFTASGGSSQSVNLVVLATRPSAT